MAVWEEATEEAERGSEETGEEGKRMIQGGQGQPFLHLLLLVLFYTGLVVLEA